MFFLLDIILARITVGWTDSVQNQRRLVAHCKHHSLGKAVSMFPIPFLFSHQMTKGPAPLTWKNQRLFAHSEEVIDEGLHAHSLLWEGTCEAGLCLTPLLWEAALWLQSTLRLRHPIIWLQMQHAYSYVETNSVSQMNFCLEAEADFTDFENKHGYQRGEWGQVRDKSGSLA